MMNEIAERYSQGLFDLAMENNTLEEKKNQSEEIVKVLDENPEVRQILQAVKIKKDEKKEFINKVFSPFCDQEIVNFIKLIIDKGRVFYLKDIFKMFIELANEQLGYTKATIVSAKELSDDDYNKLIKAIEVKTNKKVILTKKIDKSVIAGIKVIIGNNVTDITMSSKIEKMRNSLLKGGKA